MIETQNFSISYTADGSQTQWAFPYPYLSGDDILLYIVIDGIKTLVDKTYYTFDTTTNKITYPLYGDPLASGTILSLERSTPITQLEDSSLGNFKSNDIERMADKLTMISQETIGTVASIQKAGVIQIASQEEVNAGVNDSKAVVPLTLAAKLSADISTHNASGTAHSDIRADVDSKMPQSGGTFTGDITISNGKKINFQHYEIGENVAGNAIIGDGNGNGLVVLPNGQGAALFTSNGTSYTELVKHSDIKSTYNASGTDPINGTGVAAAISTKQDNLSASQLAAVNSGIDNTKVAQIAANTTSIGNEILNRQAGDVALQGQIDALKAASDVVDVVATYAELQSYDTSKLTDKDLIKVLADSTHDNAETYYRWSTSSSSFSYVGSAGASYTKAEANAKFLSQTDASSTYETQSAAATALAAKASNADGTTITDSGSAISTVAVKEQGAGVAIKLFDGLQTQVPAIGSRDAHTLYITDETDVEAITVDSALSLTSEHPVQNKVITNALQNIDALPSQTGHSGEFLTTDGSSASWATVQAGGTPTLTWYTGNTGTTVTIADTSSANLVKIYKNGLLLQPTEDYTISGTTLTMVTALVATDKITVEVF